MFSISLHSLICSCLKHWKSPKFNKQWLVYYLFLFFLLLTSLTLLHHPHLSNLCFPIIVHCTPIFLLSLQSYLHLLTFSSSTITVLFVVKTRKTHIHTPRLRPQLFVFWYFSFRSFHSLQSRIQSTIYFAASKIYQVRIFFTNYLIGYGFFNFFFWG